MATSASYSTWPQGTSLRGYIHFNAVTPCDDRLVYDTKSAALQKTKGRRYIGLRIYVFSEEKEYWFKEGVSDDHLVEYKPWLIVYETRAAALQDTKLSRNVGLKIYISGEGKEYWFKDDVLDANLVEYNPWSNEIATELAKKPWMADISSGSGSSSGSSVPVYSLSPTNCTQNEIPGYLETIISETPTAGSEVNVVYTEGTVPNTKESFIKYVYLNGSWCISSGTQTITFDIPDYSTWDNWTPPASTSSIIYQKKNDIEGSLTVMAKHNFSTQCVDTSFYFSGSEDLDADGEPEPYGEEVLVRSRCTTLSNHPGFWVILEFQIPKSANPSTNTYTLLLQR